MSFSSNIFTNLPLVHTLNPDFLGQQLWLCFSAGSWMSSRETPELSPRQIPELVFLWSSRRRQLEVPGLRMFVTLLLHRIKIPELRTFTNSGLHRFRASENREFPAPEKHVSRTLSNLTLRGWRVFLNSPTMTEQNSHCSDGWWLTEQCWGACLNKKLTDKNNFPRYMAFLFDVSNSAGKKRKMKIAES
jgi:hypothetical protein